MTEVRDVRMSSLAKMPVGVEDVVVEGVELDDARQAVVVDARPHKPHSCECGRCGREAPRHDGGKGARLWRCRDLAGTRVYVRCDALRVDCPERGATVHEVPWAAHGPWFAHAFGDTCRRCAPSMGKLACQRPMRVSWRTVGAICSRVEAGPSEGRPPRAEGPAGMGVGETSHRKGHGRKVFDALSESLAEGRRATVELAGAVGAKRGKQFNDECRCGFEPF